MNFSFAGKSLLETSEQKKFCVPIQKKKPVENIATGNKLKIERKNIDVHTNLQFIKRIEIWIRENSNGAIYDKKIGIIFRNIFFVSSNISYISFY